MYRLILSQLELDIKEKMVFLAGPRQVGKTTIAKEMVKKQGGVYLNWDSWKDRSVIQKSGWLIDNGIVALDELHKYPKWKNYIKGCYDTKPSELSFIVTGSARLDIYRRGGDSLLGRYHLHRIHPLSLSEIAGQNCLPEPFAALPLSSDLYESHLNSLVKFGGFPEPFLRQSEDALRRWQNSRYERIVREDIRDLTSVRDLSGIETLISLLRDRIASPLSIRSLNEDIQVSYSTVAAWMDLLERMYVIFRVLPWHERLERALKKEPKVYAWDWTTPSSVGAQLENLVASHLLKFCHALQDRRGFRTALWYVRDRDKRECDFLMTIDNKPWFLVEVKSGHSRNSNVSYFKNKLNVPFAYVVSPAESVNHKAGDVIHASLGAFLYALGV